MDLSPLYAFMDSTLGMLFHLSSDEKLGYMIGVFIIASLVSLFISIVTNRVVDQQRMRELREKLKEYQSKLMDAQKKGNTKEMAKLQGEMMKMQSEMLSSSLKPMFYTMVPIIILFAWLRHHFPPGFKFVDLPFYLPIWGNKLGWFGWYFMSSIAVSPLIKKILKLDR